MSDSLGPARFANLENGEKLSVNFQSVCELQDHLCKVPSSVGPQ